MTKEAPGYKDLKRVIGIWDDHDYGLNDSGIEFPNKDINRDLWLDFIDEPEHTDRRTQKGTPIH